MILAIALLVTAAGAFVFTKANSTGTYFVVTTAAATGAPLVPGGPARTIAFTVANPDGPAKVLDEVSVTITDAGGAPWSVPGCSAADFTVGVPAIGYGEIAPSGAVTGTVTVTMNDAATDQAGCANEVVPLRVVAQEHRTWWPLQRLRTHL